MLAPVTFRSVEALVVLVEEELELLVLSGSESPLDVEEKLPLLPLAGDVSLSSCISLESLSMRFSRSLFEEWRDLEEERGDLSAKRALNSPCNLSSFLSNPSSESVSEKEPLRAWRLDDRLDDARPESNEEVSSSLLLWRAWHL